MWRWALQDSLTILALLPELLVNIAQRVPMPFGMSMINTYFRKLKLSEYQPIVCGIPPQNWKTHFGKVMNRSKAKDLSLVSIVSEGGKHSLFAGLCVQPTLHIVVGSRPDRRVTDDVVQGMQCIRVGRIRAIVNDGVVRQPHETG